MSNKKNKYERIDFVKQLGFNTEDNFLIKPTHNEDHYIDFINEHDYVSIRSFDNKDSHYSPAYAHVRSNEAKTLISQLQKDNYNVILATPINPDDCLFAGCVHKTSANVVTEIADGPGTVRRVTHEGVIDRRYYGLNTNDKNLNYCLQKIKKTPLENVIFEFSYYNTHVGIKKDNFIVWEITDDGTGNSGI